MSKKDLYKFKPEKLKPGRSWSTEIVRADGYHETHYFYRDKDGELFATITRNHNTGDQERRAWAKLKRAKVKDLKQLELLQSEKAGH